MVCVSNAHHSRACDAQRNDEKWNDFNLSALHHLVHDSVGNEALVEAWRDHGVRVGWLAERSCLPTVQ